jgi:D-threo-aldose 1-dehydrogenase
VNETEIVKELVACAPIDVVLLAGRHTLLDRTAEQSGFFSLCGDRGISVMIGGVFNSGLLVDPEADDATFDYRPVRAEERDQARCWANHSARHGVALPAAALAFARARRDVTRVLVGPGSLAEWRQIQAWASAEVSAELFGLAL